MAKQRVDIVVAAKDQASRKMGGIAKAAIGMAAAFVSWRAIKGLVLDTTAAYAEQERAESKLRQALKATGNAAGFTFGQLKDYAAQLQQNTEFGDENIETMMSLMATFKNVQGPVFTESTRLILDMSTAMDQGLKETAIQVGKALNDPILGVTALRRVGVQLSEQQHQQVKDFMAVNDIASAQRIIMDELASEFGGQASANVKTFSGQMKQLSNDFGDAKERLGGFIANIPGLTTGFGIARTVIQNFGLSMDILWTGAKLSLTSFWEEMKHAFTVNLPEAIVWFAENWKSIFSDIWNAYKTYWKNIGELAFVTIKSIVNVWAEGWKALWEFLKNPTKGIDLSGYFNKIKEGFQNVAKEVNLYEGIEFKTAGPEFSGRLKTGIEKDLESQLNNLTEQFGMKFKGIIDPTLTAPTPGTPGAGLMDPTTAAKASKGVAAVEARFLAGSSTTKDYQKETAGNTKQQTHLLALVAKKLDGINETLRPRGAAVNFQIASIA